MANKTRIWLSVAVITVLILIGGGLYFWYSKRQIEANPISSNTQTVNENQSTQGIKFDLYKEAGIVSFKGENDKNYVDLQEDQLSLNNKSFIKTGADTEAHIIFNDNSMISLDQNSEIQVVYNGNDRNIIQSAGNSWHRLQKLTQGNNYQVETSNTLATVRGTIFGVKVEDGLDSSVYVLESQVQVNQQTMENGKKITKDIQMVQEGKHMGIPDFKKGKKMDLTDISDDKKNTGWFEKNRFLDQDYKNEKAKDMMKKMKNDSSFKEKLKKIKEKRSKKSSILEINKENLSSSTGILGALLGSNTSCGDLINQKEFDQGMAEMEKSSQMAVKTGDFLKNYFAKLREFCADGQLSSTETAQITLLVQEFSKNLAQDLPNNLNLKKNDIDPSKLRSTNGDAKTFESYLKFRYDNQSGNACNQATADNIANDLQTLTQLENYYGQDYNRFVNYLKLLQTSCRDGVIDAMEKDLLLRLVPASS